MEYRVLVIEDEHRMRRVLQLLLEERGYHVRTAGDGVQGMALWEQWAPHAVLTDIRLPKADGMKILGFKNEKRLRAPLIMLTGFGTIEMAVEAIKQGAFDYLTKPFDNEKVVETVRRAIEESGCFSESQGRSGGAGEPLERRLVGSSPVIRKLWQEIDLVAGSRTSVLITGESGTGKELVARALHARGDRGQKPFVKVNCSAIPRDLLESELFGHRRGAFTGAVSDREGCFLGADGGTIFLDEIGDLPLDLQPKLLHAVEEKTITPVGGSQAFRVDVKIVSATNRDIDRMMEEGRFRGDLFFRLNAFHIHVPPLRERIEDIRELAPYFLERFSMELDKPDITIEDEALGVMNRYDWPGNVRELRNVIERAVLSCKNRTIRADDLPHGLTMDEDTARTGQTNHSLDLEAQEKRLIEEAIEQTNGNQAQAARLLKITRNTLRYRMKKYGIIGP